MRQFKFRFLDEFSLFFHLTSKIESVQNVAYAIPKSQNRYDRSLDQVFCLCNYAYYYYYY